MIKYVMMLWMVVTETAEMCGEGCLKCNERNQCLICDVTNKYYLSDFSCKYSRLDQCSMLNLDGQCAKCQENYYLDGSTKRCVAVQSSKLISNCLYYGGDQSCVQCSADYFLSGSRCEKVSKLVDNCENYSGDGVCSECADRFIFNTLRNACKESPKNKSCYGYTHLECKRCVIGYAANTNFDLSSYVSNSSLVLPDIRAFTSGGYRDWTPLQYCQKIQMKNCLVAISSTNCIKCEDGYFLTSSKNCRATQKPGPIDFCYAYSSNTTCSECYDDYYLETDTKCAIINQSNAILDCVSYNRTAHIVQCVKCADIKYLDNGNCLSSRVDSLNITNCEATSINSDTCSVCKNNYVLTSDDKACLSAIPRCSEYEPSTITTTKLRCKTCSYLSYLNIESPLRECLDGKIEGCFIYSSKTACASCYNSKYFLRNSQCTHRDPIAYCREYSETNINECKSCDTGYFPFRFYTKCLQKSTIQNCVDYIDANTCEQCMDGFSLIDNKCVCTNERFGTCRITTNDSSIVKICKDGQFWINLPDYTGCWPNHFYTQFCDETKTGLVLSENGQTNSGSCRACKIDCYPINLQNMFVCIDNMLLSTKGISDSNRVANCLKYDIKNAIPICVQCPHYLKISFDNKYTCVETCDEITHTFIADNLNGFYNTCAPQNHTIFGLPNCAKAIKVYKGDTLALECVMAKPQFLIAVSLDSYINNPSCYQDIANSTVPRPEGAFFYQGFYTIIYEKNSTSNKHENKDNEKMDCELYYKNNGSLNCVRCKWGYSVVFNADNNTSNCVLVSECDTSVSYTGFSMVLNRLLSCHSCIKGKVLTVNIEIIKNSVDYVQKSFIDKVPALQCVTPTNNNSTIDSPLLVPNCLIYGWFTVSSINSTVANGCIACQPGFKLTQNFGSCVEIANCDKTKSFMANRCSACTQTNSNNQTEYKAFKDYYADSCHLVSTDNCLFVNYVDGGQAQMDCRVCIPGFWLNYDKKCENIILLSCSYDPNSRNFYSSNEFNSVDAVAEYFAFKYLSKAVSLNGCNVCYTNYTGLKLQTDERQCVYSPYVIDNTFNEIDQVSYITDCEMYQLVDPNQTKRNSLCEKCKNNKIPNSTRDKCVTSKDAGCRIALAEDPFVCSDCFDSYVLSFGRCKNIENCLAYDQSPQVSNVTCKECIPEYVLAANKTSCYKGNVFACKSYDLDLPWVCKTCFDGFALLNTTGSKTYCISINENANCFSVDNTDTINLQKRILRCKMCAKNNVLGSIQALYQTLDTSLGPSICLKLNQIEGCISYGTSETSVSANSFLCERCSDGYYLDETDYICISRNNKPSGCQEFYSNMDKFKKMSF